MLLLAAAALLFILVLRSLARQVVFFFAGIASAMPPKLAESATWIRLRSFHDRLAGRHPGVASFISRRINPRQPTGLLLTLMVLAALYLTVLFSGLTEEILEAPGTHWIDDSIHAALQPWRIEPLVSIFLWITNLGSSFSVVAAVVIATGFLWSQGRVYIVIPLWVTCIGALTTTTIGKLLIGRHRPEITLDVIAPGWSFPSGHATVAMAVYGFIAYAIARTFSSVSERFEVSYWTAMMIGLIGFSRIFLGVHYFTDVIGGFLVGAFWLLIGCSIAELNRPPGELSRTANEESR